MELETIIRGGLAPKNMTTSKIQQFQDIQAQIAALQEQAQVLMMESRAEAIRTVKELISTFSLAASDIGIEPKIIKTPAKKPRTRPAKYRDPVSGQTWTGQGMQPKWMEGRNRDDFLIEKPPVPPQEPQQHQAPAAQIPPPQQFPNPGAAQYATIHQQ